MKQSTKEAIAKPMKIAEII